MQSLLLRLFESDFFNCWIAVFYLFKYQDVGIQEYLCMRLRSFPIEELEFLLPQLCHLLVTRVNEAISLEFFLLSLCKSSTHIAILTLWHLESYVNDYKNRKGPPLAYERVSRLLTKFQTFLLEHGKESSIMDYVRIYPDNVGSLIVGMSCVAASMASPKALENTRELVLKQGSVYRWPTKLLPLPLPAPNASSTTAAAAAVKKPANHPSSSSSPLSSSEEVDANITSLSANMLKRQSITALQRNKILSRFPSSPPSLEELHRGRAFSLHRYLVKTKIIRASQPNALAPQSWIATSADTSSLKGSHAASTPLRPRSNSLHHHQYASYPNIPHFQAAQLSTGHYYHSEMQFVTSLIDISSRLSRIPKEARQKALQAELNLLNHNLPANVCIPLWCKASVDSPEHHKVVRISPNDAVILNSAERVPYLIMVEVLENESEESLQALMETLEQSKKNAAASTKMYAKESISNSVSSLASHPLSSAIEELAQPPTTEHREPGKKLAFRFSSPDLSRQLPANDAPLVAASKSDELLYATTSQKSPHVHHAEQALAAAHIKSRLGTSNSLADYRAKADVPNAALQSLSLNGSAPSSAAMDASSPHVTVEDFSEKMRTAAILLAQLHQKMIQTPSSACAAIFTGIRSRIIKEMENLEVQRLTALAAMNYLQASSSNGSTDTHPAVKEELPAAQGWEVLEAMHLDKSALSKEDPSAIVFKEGWSSKEERIRASSPFGFKPNWRLLSVIVKANSDLRQEQLAVQLILEMKRIWELESLPTWVHYYKILLTSDHGGLIETITDSISVHSIKKEAYLTNMNKPGISYTLLDYYIKSYGDVESNSFKLAQEAFLQSLVGYSLVTYILALKDRHNGNILIDAKGHLIHIDFGFMLSNSPGYVGFETAPFKLTQEYIDILGGHQGEPFMRFKSLLVKSFLALRKHADHIILMVEMMGKDSRLPCFYSGEAAVQHLKERFQLSFTESQVTDFIERLIASSSLNMFTRLYDTFQYYSNGIL